MKTTVTVYTWPDSQICLDCRNRMEDVIMDGSSVLCGINCENNDGISCPKFEQAEEKEEE